MQRLQNSKENRPGQPLAMVTTEKPRFGVIGAIFAIGVLLVASSSVSKDSKPSLPESRLPPVVPHCLDHQKNCNEITGHVPLDVRLKMLSEENPSTADSYHTLGDTFSAALWSKQRALDIRLKLFGGEHSSTADSYHSLGDTQQAQGNFSAAVWSKQRTLDIRLKLFGEEHSSTADSYHTLGDTQQAQGNFSAFWSKQRALDIRLKLFGEEHSSTADSYHTLGDTTGTR